MSVSELLTALQTGLQTGEQEDLQHALDQGTDDNLKAVSNAISREGKDVLESWDHSEYYSIMTDALLLTKLMIHTPSLIGSPEVREVIRNLHELIRFVENYEPQNDEVSIDNFLRASGYGQEQRWNQRLSLGLH